MRNVDEFWDEAFEKYNIIEEIKKNHFFEITNENIKNDMSKRYEPRLVTKFDTINSLPNAFKKKNGKKIEVLYSILPYKKSGTYCIVPHNIYQMLDVEFKIGMKINKLSIPDYIISVDKTKITSEANAINIGIISGMFQHFLNDEKLLTTVSGRMRSGEWNFRISDEINKFDINYPVKSTQMEIDGSLESDMIFALIEAKNKLNNDFLIRQLYYPYRDFYEKFGDKKNIRNIFMIYNAGIYILLEYEFLEYDNMKSISLIKKEYYILGELLNKKEVVNILTVTTNKVKDTKVFPQADDLFKVLNSIELFADDHEEYLTSLMVKEYYNFDQRQGNYYKQALCFLGLIDGNQNSQITNLGKEYLKSNFENKIKIIIQSLAEYNEVMRKIMWDVLISDKEFKVENYLDIFEASESTVERRLQTIKKWVIWLKTVIE